MRLLALGLFSGFSILLLWYRGISRSHSISRDYFTRHLGISRGVQDKSFLKKHIKRISVITGNIHILGSLRSSVEKSGIEIAWDTVIIIWLWLIFALPMLAIALFGNILILPLTVTMVLLLPLPCSAIVRRIQKRNLVNQSEQFTGDLALYLQCGIPIERAVNLGAQDYGQPIKEHLDKIQAELSVGRNPDIALGELADLLDDSELELIAQTVKTSRETGADISRVMESVGTMVRERSAIKRELRTQTIQGKMSGQLVAALPLLFLLLTTVVSKRTLIMLITTVPGLIMLGAAIVLDLIGFLWINKILDIKI